MIKTFIFVFSAVRCTANSNTMPHRHISVIFTANVLHCLRVVTECPRNLARSVQFFTFSQESAQRTITLPGMEIESIGTRQWCLTNDIFFNTIIQSFFPFLWKDLLELFCVLRFSVCNRRSFYYYIAYISLLLAQLSQRLK